MTDQQISAGDQVQISFVSMAAHELRTPLTAIIGYVESLKESLSASLTVEQDHELKQLAANAKLLENLIENLLNISHLASGSFEVIRAPTDLVGLTREITERFQDQARAKSQELRVVLPEESPPLVLADRGRIGQVLSNLIINAINYTDQQGKIEVTVFSESSFVGVSVKDTGIGISPQDLDQIFNKYFRASGALKAGAKGTGLGLYISKQIIDLHQGRITAESKVGSGSKFTLYLPIVGSAHMLESKQ